MKKINVKDLAIKAAGVGAGAYAAQKLNSIQFVKDQKPALRGAVKMAIGALLPAFLAKGKKAAIIEGVGNGMIAVGALEVASAFDDKMPSLAGIGAGNDVLGAIRFDESYTRPVSGPSDVMGGTTDLLVEL
jgi:hypothetical protein